MDTQKINSNKLKNFGIVVASFSIDNKNGKSCFFEKTFLLANINIDVAFRISFLTLSNIKVNFNNCKLR